MALENGAQLAEVLARPDRLGRVFARHAYGMREWVDRFSARVPHVDDLEAKALIAALVADNARHMLLFRERAAAHGVDPDSYVCTPEGDAIYERIEELETLGELAGYALGSLDHFDELLAVYGSVAEEDDALAIASVRADVARMREALGELATDRHPLAAEAHERYRVRELAEAPRYAHAA